MGFGLAGVGEAGDACGEGEGDAGGCTGSAHGRERSAISSSYTLFKAHSSPNVPLSPGSRSSVILALSKSKHEAPKRA